ncbi:MAG: hypothetical protein AB7G93_12805 [Bdellovibrionales bacterium]
MKRLLILPVVLGLIVIGALLIFNSGFFHPQMEARLRQATGADVRLGRMQVALKWPLTLNVLASQISHPAYVVQWSSLRVELASLFPPYAVRVFLKEPKVVWRGTHTLGTNSDAASRSAAQPGGVRTPIPLRLNVQIENGDIKIPRAHVTGLDMQFEQKVLMQSVARLNLRGHVRTDSFLAAIPLSLETDSLTLTPTLVKTNDLRAAAGGLVAQVQGTSLIADDRHRWELKLHVPDLAQLPKPPMEIPAQNWRGAVYAEAVLSKSTAAKPWEAEGNLKARGVRAEMGYQGGNAKLRGPVSLDLEGRFAYLDGKPSLPALSGALDLSGADVSVDKLLEKRVGVPFVVRVQAGGSTESLTLKELSLRFWEAQATVTGAVRVAEGYPANLDIQVLPVGLGGLEKLVIPLRASPVQGQLSASVRIVGPLQAPLKGRIQVLEAHLKDFAAAVDYGAKGSAVQIHGPVRGNFEGKGEWNQEQVLSADVGGRLDMSRSELVLGPLQKPAEKALNLRFDITHQEQRLRIDRFHLDSSFGQIHADGTVKSPLQPELDLRVRLQPLNLQALRSFLPAYRELIPGGEVKGDVRLNGQIPTAKPWFEWPLVAQGQVQVQIPEYEVGQPAKKASAAGAPPPGTATPESPGAASEAFLPEAPLTKKSRLQVQAQVGKVKMPGLVLLRVSTKGMLAGGSYRGDVTVDQVLGGRVQVRELEIPLLERRPRLAGSATWSQIDVRQALEFFKPELKGLAEGKSSGQANFTTLMPSDTEFFKRLQANGETEFNPVTLNFVNIGKMINEIIAKVPAVKISPVKMDPLHGQAKVRFALAEERVELPSVHAQDVSGSELQVGGNVALADMNADLRGEFRWAKPQVKGCLLEGNSDTEGRMVIPIAIKGQLTSPSYSLLSDTASKLAAKALECESKKLVDKVKKEGAEKLGKEVDKALKGIFGKGK